MNEEKKENATVSAWSSEGHTLDWTNHEHTLAFVTKVCKQVDKRRNEEKSRLVKSMLHRHRDLVLQKRPYGSSSSRSRINGMMEGQSTSPMMDDSTMRFPLLPSHTQPRCGIIGGGSGSQSREYKVNFLESKKWKRQQTIQPVMIESMVEGRPTSKSTVFLKSSFSVEDEKDLNFVPYFGDDDQVENNVISELFDTKKREELIDCGPEHMKKDRNEFIDQVLEIVMGCVEERIRSSSLTTYKIDLLDLESIMYRVQDHIACIKGFDRNIILARYTIICEPRMTKIFKGQESEVTVSESTTDGDIENTGTSVPAVMNSEMISDDDIVPYEGIMDSFRHLFCRRCFVYDCNRHGVVQQTHLELQTALAIRKEMEGGWQDGKEDIKNGTPVSLPENNDESDLSLEMNALPEQSNARPFSMNSSIPSKKLSPVQRAVIEHACQVFQGNHRNIASILGLDENDVRAYVHEHDIPSNFDALQYCQVISQSADKKCNKKKKRKHNESSKNHFDPAWLKRVQRAEIHPSFEPCDHAEPCSEETCPCAQNAFFCTKHCLWGKDSKYFFNGCKCKKGECNLKTCPCFASGRECDPDLCFDCGACTDEPNKPASKQRCRNDNIGMRRHCHLLVAKSHVEEAGWGLYNKKTLKKGDFIHEYVGELISQEEADRRGCIYDKVNRSYLFNLTSDSVIDASRKGNKTKFMNHSSTPNCFAKVVWVNGDARIGIYAKEDIEPQTELYFDYRYDVGMSNHLIEKPAMEVAWMKKEKQLKNNINRKHAKQGGKKD
jgi:Proteins containing SET domain